MWYVLDDRVKSLVMYRLTFVLAKYLPKACTGEAICGMAMSEPNAGTDVLAMKTNAKVMDDGSYCLNGSKMWITNGAINDTELGDAFLVYARTGTGPPVHVILI